MRKVWSGGFILLAVGLAPASAEAHVRMLAPIPRSSEAYKIGPCGGDRRTEAPLVLEAGAEIVIEWEEYVDHPGYYQILFSTGGDANFVMLLDRIPDRRPAGSAPRYSAAVILPATPCEAGTLQLIQVMTENPSRPELYFACADIRLVEPAPEEFRRGDANDDGKVDISDGVRTFEFLFLGGAEIACMDAGDSNDDGRVDVSDGINTLNWLFGSGHDIPAPGPRDCGPDPSGDLAACGEHANCP